MIRQTYDLSMVPGVPPVVIHVKQYDTAPREIVLNLYAEDAPFAIPAGAAVSVRGTKPDKTGFAYRVTDFSGNSVTVEMQEQMTVLAGPVPSQLAITENGGAVGSAAFVLDVEAAALADDTAISKTELAELQSILQDTQTAAGNAADAASDAGAQAAAAAASATSADSSATNAASSASAADEAAQNATAKAAEAASSAEVASGQAETAKGQAQTATDKANEAAASAASADVSAANATAQASAAASAATTASGQAEAAARSAETLTGMIDDVNGLLTLVKSMPNFFAGLSGGGAGFHNSIYRGKNLGGAVMAEQWAAIQAGTFDDLFIGDYWEINNVVWRIAAFDYFLGTGDSKCTAHHATLIPDSCLYDAIMHGSSGTDLGVSYTSTDMYKTNLETAKTTIKTAFSGHVLNHREWLTNAVRNGAPVGGAWFDSEVELMSESMVYGSGIMSPASDGDTLTANFTLGKTLLPLFAHDPSKICNGETWWLRDSVTPNRYAVVFKAGISYVSIVGNSLGVRPAFSICG